MKKLLLLTTLLLTSIVNAGELVELFEHQQILKAGYKDPRWEKKQPKRVMAKTEIGLERTPCYGSCPSYSVIIKEDGSFIYFGYRHVKKVGKHSGTIPVWKIKKLIQYSEEIKYKSLRNRYAKGITDHPTVYTYIKTNNSSKVISNYANAAPATVWVLEQMIDSFIAEAKWSK